MIGNEAFTPVFHFSPKLVNVHLQQQQQTHFVHYVIKSCSTLKGGKWYLPQRNNFTSEQGKVPVIVVYVDGQPPPFSTDLQPTVAPTKNKSVFVLVLQIFFVLTKYRESSFSFLTLNNIKQNDSIQNHSSPLHSQGNVRNTSLGYSIGIEYLFCYIFIKR